MTLRPSRSVPRLDLHALHYAQIIPKEEEDSIYNCNISSWQMISYSEFRTLDSSVVVGCICIGQLEYQGNLSNFFYYRIII